MTQNVGKITENSSTYGSDQVIMQLSSVRKTLLCLYEYRPHIFLPCIVCDYFAQINMKEQARYR
jgi:hypothetical protein